MREPDPVWEADFRNIVPGIRDTERAAFAVLTGDLPASAHRAVGRPALNPELYIDEPWRTAVAMIRNAVAAGHDPTDEALFANNPLFKTTLSGAMNLLRGPDVTAEARAEVVGRADRLAAHDLRRTWFYESGINRDSTFWYKSMLSEHGEPADTVMSLRLRESAVRLSDAGRVLAVVDGPLESLPPYEPPALTPTPPAFDLSRARGAYYIDDVEAALVAWCRQDPDGLRAVAGWLRTEDFSTERTQNLWREAVADLDRKASANPTNPRGVSPADDAIEIATATAKRHYVEATTALHDAAVSPRPTQAADRSALLSENEGLIQSFVVAHHTLERLLCSSAASEALAVLRTPVTERRAQRAVPKVGQLVNPALSAGNPSGEPGVEGGPSRPVDRATSPEPGRPQAR